MGEHDGYRLPRGDIRVSGDRRAHILDGDKTGGGHGVSSPGKTEFPASWDDTKVMAKCRASPAFRMSVRCARIGAAGGGSRASARVSASWRS